GITTNIARNARIRRDPEGRGRTPEEMAADFEAVTMTSPGKAAEIICRGVERGKARILVGPDAYVFDALARVAPTHYFDVMAVLDKRLRSRQGGGRRTGGPGSGGAAVSGARVSEGTAGGGAAVREHVDVLIVGAGLSGIGAAHHIQTSFPGRTYTILEARDVIGGTWDLFRYPGVRSDSDM